MNILVFLGIFLLLALAFLIWRESQKKERVKRILDEKLFLPKEVRREKIKKAPVSGVCYSCGKKTTMPYKCKFCGNLFCDRHRLPENHECAGLKRLKRDKSR